jgi:segregation and condensation protein B
MAAAEQLGQAVIEFDPTATVETVVIEETEEVVLTEEFVEDAVQDEQGEQTVQAEEDTPESDEQSDETK